VPPWIQVRVLESSRILQPVSKHSVETDVGDPDEGEFPTRLMVEAESVSRQQQRADIRVDGVVRDGSQADIDGVADHGKIGHQKEQDEQEPTAVAPMVGKETDSEDDGPFEM